MQYERDLIEIPSGLPTLSSIDAGRIRAQVFWTHSYNSNPSWLGDLTIVFVVARDSHLSMNDCQSHPKVRVTIKIMDKILT